MAVPDCFFFWVHESGASARFALTRQNSRWVEDTLAPDRHWLASDRHRLVLDRRRFVPDRRRCRHAWQKAAMEHNHAGRHADAAVNAVESPHIAHFTAARSAAQTSAPLGPASASGKSGRGGHGECERCCATSKHAKSFHAFLRRMFDLLAYCFLPGFR
jgi:hypothetical protein